LIENTMMNTDLPIREPDQIRYDCTKKLRAVQVGDHFQAILGCLLGERACPPGDFGGVWVYFDFPEAIRDKKQEQHEEMLKWIGGRFDSEAFDRKQVTKEMKNGSPDWRKMS